MTKLKNIIDPDLIGTSVGGITYDTAVDVIYARAKICPTRKQAPDYLNLMADVMTVINTWAAVSDEDKAAWKAYALINTEQDCHGKTKHITGFGHFVKVNGRRYHKRHTIIHTPPHPPPVLWPYVIGLYYGMPPGNYRLTWGGPYESGYEVQLKWEKRWGKKTSLNINNSRHLAVVPFESHFYYWPCSMQLYIGVWYRTIRDDDGRVSDWYCWLWPENRRMRRTLVP